MSASASARVRAYAARAVDAVLHRGRALDDALDAERAHVPASDAALLQELAYGAVRWSFALDSIIDSFASRPFRKSDSDVRALIAVGLYQLRSMQVPAHAAVSETVAAVEALRKPWAEKLVNAILRRYQREADSVERALVENEVALYSHPAWLLRELRAAWPEHWQAVARANNERPPLSLRVNTTKTTREAYLQSLAAVGLSARPGCPDTCVLLDQSVPVAMLPNFDSGWVSVQDAAAQWAAALLDAQPGERVLDACAAPGGKAAHILERSTRLDLLALDQDPARVQRIGRTFSRLGLSAQAKVGDATQPHSWWDQRPYDAILLDAPCSGTGVIRRHPDIKIHRTPADIARLQALQAELLSALWPLLARGAKLLYATCSVLPSENEEQIMQFRARHTDAVEVTLTLPGALVRPAGVQVLPGSGDMDGFYYACLRKI